MELPELPIVDQVRLSIDASSSWVFRSKCMPISSKDCVDVGAQVTPDDVITSWGAVETMQFFEALSPFVVGEQLYINFDTVVCMTESESELAQFLLSHLSPLLENPVSHRLPPQDFWVPLPVVQLPLLKQDALSSVLRPMAPALPFLCSACGGRLQGCVCGGN
ncbi:hypothetical protein Aperf_G00000121996 [Anoplocephala perfoliata]